ncbi:MAG: hypothetical protein KO206_02465 [Methanomicrobiaceae archaeon]|nr:hypothetical protein [Methanomicrobiaceae archaeon]
MKRIAYLERIPVDARWKIAGSRASALPIMYRKAFRQVTDELSYNEIERDIWRGLGREAGIITSAFRLPVEDAGDIAGALIAASQTLYGPEYAAEITEATPGRATLAVKECPLLNRANEMEADPKSVCNACHAYANAAVEGMNQHYGIHYAQGMCTGDASCILTITRKR